MKLLVASCVAIVAIGGLAVWLGLGHTRRDSMKLTSVAFAEGGVIGQTYTCLGQDVNPALAISGVPAGSRSLALVLSDPDAPGGTFYHWLVWNIPATVTAIPENWSVPAGTGIGRNGFGKTAYGGPCPPSGTHHYHFTLYALGDSLKVRSGAGWSELSKAMSGQILEQTELTGTVSASH